MASPQGMAEEELCGCLYSAGSPRYRQRDRRSKGRADVGSTTATAARPSSPTVTRRIDFDDGDSVTITELPESGTEPAKTGARYRVPSSFKLEVFDAKGMRIGLDGQRYSPKTRCCPTLMGRRFQSR
jgi:hypothetical protein